MERIAFRQHRIPDRRDARAESCAKDCDDRNTNVIVFFKFVSVVGYGLIGLLIGLTLRRVAPRRTLTGVYLFLWNPLAST
jgi:hypothetical protein